MATGSSVSDCGVAGVPGEGDREQAVVDDEDIVEGEEERGRGLGSELASVKGVDDGNLVHRNWTSFGNINRPSASSRLLLLFGHLSCLFLSDSSLTCFLENKLELKLKVRGANVQSKTQALTWSHQTQPPK